VIFVAGLAHSGSTLLHQLLAAHPSVLGVGEAYQTLIDGDAFRCPCSPPDADRAACPVWGPVLADHPHADPAAGYDRLLRQIGERFPEKTVVVDESKRAEALEALLAAGARVDAVQLVRDVRSWTVSTRDRAAQLGQLEFAALLKRGDVRGLAARRQWTAWRRFTVWQRRNRAIERFLQRHDLVRVRVGYENLATSPEREMRRLCQALELDFHPEMLVPARGEVHMVRGNYGNLDGDRASTITLSTKWLSRREWILPALLRRSVMADNDRLVYDRGSP
jgi:hypothetical protein